MSNIMRDEYKVFRDFVSVVNSIKYQTIVYYTLTWKFKILLNMKLNIQILVGWWF